MTTSIVFPGQGAQKIGMLADIAEAFPSVLDTYQEASEALGYDMWDMCQRGPLERLDSTEVTQPAVLTADIALFRLMQAHKSIDAVAVAGHSLGEYSALVASGVIDFSIAVALVEKRGNLMKEAVNDVTTAMAAILGLSDEQVVETCAEVAHGQCVEAVNFNSPGQVVIGGHKEAVDRAISALKEIGARRAIPIAVSVPAHSSLMRPAADKLSDTILKLPMQTPKQPIFQNVDAVATTDTDVIRAKLIQQIYVPVQWTRIMQALVSMGCQRFIECGPGKVLSGLLKKVDRQLEVTCLTDVSVWE